MMLVYRIIGQLLLCAVIHGLSSVSHPRVQNLTDENDLSTNNLTTEGNSTTDSQYDHLSSDFVSCPKILLNKQFYTQLSDLKIYLHKYNIILNHSNYFKTSDDSVYICSSNLIINHKHDTYISSYITIIGLSLSIVSLALHLLIFIIIPEYHTLAGKNTASLAACLFVAYTIFAVSWETARNTDSCPRIAATICYFFLSSFAWMKIIAFDVWISLNSGASKFFSCLTNASEFKRYLIYASYSFILPVIIVGAALIVDGETITNDHQMSVFSRSMCWFSTRTALLIFFIVPYGMLITLTFVFYVFSIYTIIKMKNYTGNHEMSPKGRFFVCLKLGAVVGLPWLIGIIAISASWKPLWYLFIFSTTLQGVYIFVSYNCNKRTWKYIQQKFRPAQKCVSNSTVKVTSTPA